MDEDKTVNIQDILMGRRTVALVGEINHKSTDEVAQRLLRLQDESQERINLVIDSGGGENRAALHLCDLLGTVMTAPVRGIAFGSCMSAATFILLHCSERVSTPYTEFLIHSGRTSGISITVNDKTADELQLLADESKANREEMVRLYMAKLKLPRKRVDQLVTQGDQRFNRTLNAVQALEIGLIQKIITENLGIFPKPPA
ncbi:MAG: ATP-dependent Clp protease proteolytic subunit [Parcubacteria group bacterium]|nr:ATP-dependent Clp protease proteolytic subunit [Parcubacteria group bacterium]